jgi:hypothetical protein
MVECLSIWIWPAFNACRRGSFRRFSLFPNWDSDFAIVIQTPGYRISPEYRISNVSEPPADAGTPGFSLRSQGDCESYLGPLVTDVLRRLCLERRAVFWYGASPRNSYATVEKSILIVNPTNRKVLDIIRE